MIKNALSGKVIWITGASSGIGRALVLELAKSEAALIISSRRKEALEEVRSACPESKQDDIHVLPLDLEQASTLAEKTNQALEIYQRLDIIIHSGGISQRAYAGDTDLEVDRRLMEVNFFGTLAITKAALPYMIHQGFGQFVVITSLMGIFSSPYRSGYAASKHALHGFFEALRAEYYDKNIHVTLVAPGFIRTNVSINALGSDGLATNTMDNGQANGMPPDECAKRIIKALIKQKSLALVGGKETFAFYLKRFFPGILEKVIRKAQVR